MQHVTINDLTLWQFGNLARFESIRHFVSGRDSNRDNDFTLGYNSTADRLLVTNNRASVALAMGVRSDKFFLPSQVHKSNVVRVSSTTSKVELQDTDALITNEKQVCIAVMSADCVPIILYDSINLAAAAVHAGWRGTVARILEKTLAMMNQTFGTKGSDVWAGIGPSVCQESYEVGEEVVGAVNAAFGNGSGLMIPQPQGKAKLDLWKANNIQLLEFGVPEEQIEISGLCTVKNNEHFYSARKGDSGRFAAGIVIK